MLVYQSGRPWDMPDNVDLAPGIDLEDVALPGKKEGQFIYGVKPCIGQRQANGTYDLLSVSQAYGCTEPYFLIREAFQRRTAMNRYDEFRRPSLFMLDVNFAKTTPITDRVRLQVRLEAFNLLNSPQYDERQYNTDTNSRGLRPHQPQHHRAVGLPALRPAGIPAVVLGHPKPGRRRPSPRLSRPALPPFPLASNAASLPSGFSQPSFTTFGRVIFDHVSRGAHATRPGLEGFLAGAGGRPQRALCELRPHSRWIDPSIGRPPASSPTSDSRKGPSV